MGKIGVLCPGGALWISTILAENVAMPLEIYMALDKKKSKKSLLSNHHWLATSDLKSFNHQTFLRVCKKSRFDKSHRLSSGDIITGVHIIALLLLFALPSFLTSDSFLVISMAMQQNEKYLMTSQYEWQ
jgi:hypothetical protein